MRKFVLYFALVGACLLFTGCDFSGKKEQEALVINDDLKKNNKPSSAEDEIVNDEKKDDKTQGKDKNVGKKTETNEKNVDLPEGMVRLYIPNDAADNFNTCDEKVNNAPDDIINLLVAKGALPRGTRALSFSINKTKKTANIDLSKEYGQKIISMGTSGENMLIGSLVNTFLTYYKIDSMTIKVEGASLETGHNIYDTPIDFYGKEKLDAMKE